MNAFKLIKQEYIGELSADASVYQHCKTRAPVTIIHCDDDNKSFIIAFHTPPENDNGVAHIIEHSVLNGSHKYPLKEPFVELLKASLYTFLNAMTYPDKTVYPVASRNDQDFNNLMDVYMDAVFNPALRELTYKQEGWHYSLSNIKDDLTYSGVVYNEMKGAYSDPETQLISHVDAALFPDSIYGLSSGGDPEHIPSLTYDGFTRFHKQFYHPSNSRTVVYGDVNTDDILTHLDRYFSEFEFKEYHSQTETTQIRFSQPIWKTKQYAVSADEDLENKTFMLRSHLLGSSVDTEEMLALTLLSRILVGTQASPLRKALMDSQLIEDVLSYGLDSDIRDMSFSVGVKGTNEADCNKICTIMDATLNELVDTGIDKKMVISAVNSIEFQLREANFGGYPKGIIYGLNMMGSWLYDDTDPLTHLKYEAPLTSIKEKIKKGRFFESLIDTYLLKNNHHVTVVMTPDAALENKKRDILLQQLAKTKDAFSDELLLDLVDQKEALTQAQLAPDSADALASIPKLPLSSINPCSEDFSYNSIEDE
ncbi:insulinase family protein, partial [bacterium AH-315-E10]|nr:insulinase family protein [bacterium AH-315-E10]